MRQADLAEKIGVSPQEVSHVGSGRYRTGKTVSAVAHTLGCSVGWLIDGTGQPPEWAAGKAPAPHIELSGPREYPVIAYAGAASDGQRGKFLDEPEMKRLPDGLALVAVRGDSAYPAIYNGQFAIVNTKRPVRANNVVAVVVGDSDDVLVKRWCPQPDNGHVVLASLDGGRDSLSVLTHDIRHVWPVVGVLYE